MPGAPRRILKDVANAQANPVHEMVAKCLRGDIASEDLTREGIAASGVSFVPSKGRLSLFFNMALPEILEKGSEPVLFKMTLHDFPFKAPSVYVITRGVFLPLSASKTSPGELLLFHYGLRSFLFTRGWSPTFTINDVCEIAFQFMKDEDLWRQFMTPDDVEVLSSLSASCQPLPILTKFLGCSALRLVERQLQRMFLRMGKENEAIIWNFVGGSDLSRAALP